LLTHGHQEECEPMPRLHAAQRARCPICRGSLRLPLAVEARATSGRPIEVVDVPCVGGYCHFDRGYTFTSLGSFQKPGMLYVHTSNDDRRTPSSEVMWVVESQVRTAVHLNFRSEHHVGSTGVERWLCSRGWRRNPNLASTVSTGIPNGPYSGPIYSKECEPGIIELMGSNTWEGVYFVFIEQRELLRQTPSLRQDAVGGTGAVVAQPETRITDEAAMIQPVLGLSLGPISRARYEEEAASFAPPRATGIDTNNAGLTDSAPRNRQLPILRHAASIIARRCPRRRRGNGGGVAATTPHSGRERQATGMNVVNTEVAGEVRVEEAIAPVAPHPVVNNTAHFARSSSLGRLSARTDIPVTSVGVRPQPLQPLETIPEPQVQGPVPLVPPVDNPLNHGERVIRLRHSEGNVGHVMVPGSVRTLTG